jgi:hypothetical protein
MNPELTYLAIGMALPIVIYVPYRLGYIHAIRRMNFSRTEKDFEKLQEMMHSLQEMEEKTKKAIDQFKD